MNVTVQGCVREIAMRKGIEICCNFTQWNQSNRPQCSKINTGNYYITNTCMYFVSL